MLANAFFFHTFRNNVCVVKRVQIVQGIGQQLQNTRNMRIIFSRPANGAQEI